MPHKRIYLIFYLLLFAVQAEFCFSRELKFKKIDSKSGLAQNNISSITQDLSGFIWIGTKDGLNKYDGYNFSLFRKDLPIKNASASNDIKIISLDKQGYLWIKNVNGTLDLLNLNNEKFESQNYNFTNIQAILHDDDNNTWIGTAGNGVYKIDKKNKRIIQYKHSNKPNAISSNEISTIKKDSDGNIWIGTSNAGINIIEKNSNKLIKHIHNPKKLTSIPNNKVKYIFEDIRKNIWVAFDKAGLFLYKKENREFIAASKINDLLGKSSLLAIQDDSNGVLWIGTENEGLFLYDPIKNTTFRYKHLDDDANSIGSNTISTIFRDKVGNMWMGTSNNGIILVKTNSERFKHFNHNSKRNSLSNNIVNAFFEDSENNIWIATDGGGLNKFNEVTEQFEVYKTSNSNNSVSSNYILCITEDAKGNIWSGTWGHGINILDKNGNFKHLKNIPSNSSSLSNNYAFSILKDKKNRIWVGTYGGGIDVFNENGIKIKHYRNDIKNENSLSSNYILALEQDKNGNIWIGTDGRGLNQFREDTDDFEWKKFADPKIGISNLRIVAIHEDANANLWLATNYGLNKFNPKTNTNTTFFAKDGLPTDLITSVITDKKGFIWVSTYRGISRINPKNHQIENYTIEDGLQEEEFRNGKLLSKAGKIYFGGINGFNSFFPDSVKDPLDNKKVVFTNFQLFNKNVNIAGKDDQSSPLKTTISKAKEITIPYYWSVISFEFALLDYSDTDKQKYSYQLTGFDNTWHELGNKNSVTFTNLDPGSYKLKIKTLGSNGQWSKNISEIKLIITPPFWKTWWFYLLEAILVIAIIVTIFYLRLASIKKRNYLLRHQVAVRTHELSEANSFLLESNEKIQIQNISLEESNKEIKRKTEKILEQQKHIIIQKQQLENTVKELEDSNKTKDKLFSIIAHDLKNPMAALSGIIDMLNKKLPQLSDTEIQNYIIDINSSSSSINTLITNLLDWTRTQSKNISYKPSSINLHEIIMKNVFLVEPQLANKNINCLVNINSRHHVNADKYMIDTVIRNILSNAIKFTYPNGIINISSKATETEIALTFTDNGVGMSKEQIDEIINLKNSSISYGTIGETGTRLGLHLVQEFIDINKGTLEIQGEPDTGSIFTVYLPKTEIEESTHNFTYEFKTDKVSFSDSETDKLRGKRVLIVDDNIELRNFLKLILSGTFEIFEATNGKDAFSIAKDNQPDIIITDMIMPILNGLQFCEQIKSDKNTSHIPIVLLSSNSDDNGQLAAYEAGADTFLPKPVNQRILFSVLLNLIIKQENVKNKFAVSETIIPEGVDYNKLDEEFLETVSNYIEENIADTDLDYKKLCEITSMSRTVLYAKFKTLTGLGVHDFIKNLRLKKALQLFQEGKLNMSQIAYEVGFATPSYFSKSFTKKYNLSPKEYVAKLKEQSKKKK